MQKISICSKDDIDKLKEFLDKQWSKNHVLSGDEKLLSFQHKADNSYNFVISKNDNGQITGLLGFIPLYHFDIDLMNSNDIWLAIWKVDEAIAEPGIGFSLLKWLIKHLSPNSIGAIGINSNVAKIYNLLGYKTGILSQYYILNPSCSEYRILAKDLLEKSNTHSIEEDATLKQIYDLNSIDLEFNSFPKKSEKYIVNRYLNHPHYDYMLYGIYFKNQFKALFVIRKIETEESSCLRIVDIFGKLEEVSSVYHSLIQLLSQHNAEFIDCLNHGISKDVFEQCGFKLRDDSIIIPNYFEPFVNKNVDIQYAFKSNERDYIIYKGDSDQDRPNIIKESCIKKES